MGNDAAPVALLGADPEPLPRAATGVAQEAVVEDQRVHSSGGEPLGVLREAVGAGQAEAVSHHHARRLGVPVDPRLTAG